MHNVYDDSLIEQIGIDTNSPLAVVIQDLSLLADDVDCRVLGGPVK